MKQVRSPKKFVFSRRAPDIPDDVAPALDMATLFEPHDISISDRLIEGARIESRAAGTLRIESSILEGVSLADSRFASILWKDVRLVRCDLANTETRHLTLTRVELIDCRMTGLRAGEADCQDILVSAGDQRHCQFRVSKFKSAEFDSCNFAEADFEGTDLSGSIFRRCRLQNTEMSKVRLLNADLAGRWSKG